MRYLFIVLVCNLLLTACSTEPPTSIIDFFENDAISLKRKIQKVLETANLKKLGFTEDQSSWLKNYYFKNQYKANWINDSMLNASGIEMEHSLKKSLWFGIPEKRILLSDVKKMNWIEEEIILTAQTALILNDLNNGFLNFEDKNYKNKTFGSHGFLDSILTQQDCSSFDQILLNQRFSDTNYQFMAKKIYSFCATYPMDKTVSEIETFRLDSVHTISKTTKALVSKGYLKKSETDSLSFMNALKKFQEHNGLKQDGKVGKYTSWALNESTHNKILRAALALEKMRLNKRYPSKCVRINIPEYKLRFFVNDSLKRIHRIIVGKTENQTPQLESKIRNIVVYPFWKIPYSIASKEILPAAKRSTAYFAKNNYRIYRKEVEIDPYSINWKKIRENSFPYQVIQDPGPKNSLGIIKFEFHNNYSVYVHDTPSKSLFNGDVRSLSHGCMRCENPIELGKTILDYDSIGRKRNDLTGDSLDTLIARAENYSIHLKSPIPIFVEYITVFADRENIIFHLDIYKRDEEYLKIMKD